MTFVCADIKPVLHISSSHSSHQLALMTVALHVTTTCLDLNSTTCWGVKLILSLSSSWSTFILLWVWYKQVGSLAKVLKATIVSSVPCPVQIIYMTANILQSGDLDSPVQ